ncbi:MAG TPA: hypothetical protein VFX49_06820, partial [Chloroflexota bacterium]|nr:hypothetical protein [Chloroflexota bacterium]
ALGIGLAATGYFVNLYFVSLARGRSRKLYLTQDYERSMYFEQYVTRVRAILAALYLDVDRIHQAVFGAPYGGAIDEAMIVAGETLTGVGQTYCPLVHEHMHKGVVTPELWPICETGVAHAYKKCPLWKESK